MKNKNRLVQMDFGNLTANDVEVMGLPGAQGLKAGKYAEVRVEQKTDNKGNYTLLNFKRNSKTPQWTATRVQIPQVIFPNGAQWADLEMWSSGAPLRIVADAADRKTQCFELVFCHPDVSWTGWKKYRLSLRCGSDNLGGGVLKPHIIKNPLKIKYLLIIMRLGKSWKLGLRNLTIGLGSKK